MKKLFMIIPLVVIIGVAATVFLVIPRILPPPGDFIVVNPIDLSQVSMISTFRSCEGHDYSGFNINGELESGRSMKHYIVPTDEFKNTQGRLKALAPFDGTIVSIEREFRGAQVWLSPQENDFNFIFFHIDLLPELAVGTEVKAGQIIGHADVRGANDFDIGLKRFPPFFYLDSPFNYMSAEVLEQYFDLGIERDNIIISKQERDQNPCTFGESTEEGWIELPENQDILEDNIL